MHEPQGTSCWGAAIPNRDGTVIGFNVMEFMETHRSSYREVRKKSREKSQGEESEETEKS